jgi:hypothetical protein
MSLQNCISRACSTRVRRSLPDTSVMAVQKRVEDARKCAYARPSISSFGAAKGVDARDKRGDDEREKVTQSASLTRTCAGAREKEQVRPNADIRADRRTDAGVDGGARADHISSFRRRNAPAEFTAFSVASVCGSCGRSSGWSRQATNGFKGPARRNRRGFAPRSMVIQRKAGSPVRAHGEAGILSRP